MTANTSESDVLGVLREGRNNAANIAEALDQPVESVKSRLQTLAEAGEIEHLGNGVYEHPNPSRTADGAKETTVPGPFEDAVLRVQIEHEIAGFETVQVTRLDELVDGVLGESVPRTALVIVCHAEIARDTVDIDPSLGGMLPCTTVVYERPGDDDIYARHYSATRAIKDLGVAPDDATMAVDDLVSLTGDRMDRVWDGIESL